LTIEAKFCTAKRTHVPIGSAKFDLNRCNESPLRGEKFDFWPVSKFNTSSLPHKTIALHQTNKFVPSHHLIMHERHDAPLRTCCLCDYGYPLDNRVPHNNHYRFAITFTLNLPFSYEKVYSALSHVKKY